MSEDDDEPLRRNDPDDQLSEQEAVEKMEGETTEALLARARLAMVKRLTAKMEAGSASYQDMANLRQLLKDNGMILGLDTKKDPKSSEVPELDLPDLDKPDYE